MSKGVVRLLKISTEQNPADMLTKAVPSAKFNLYLSLAGICRFWIAAKVEEIDKK